MYITVLSFVHKMQCTVQLYCSSFVFSTAKETDLRNYQINSKCILNIAKTTEAEMPHGQNDYHLRDEIQQTSANLAILCASI